jgi:PEP-CTERM motif
MKIGVLSTAAFAAVVGCASASSATAQNLIHVYPAEYKISLPGAGGFWSDKPQSAQEFPAVGSSDGGICTVNGVGYVDPYLAIDPSFADAGDFHLVISDGVGNSPPGSIPEPSTWAMMLVGFAGLGLAGYRRAKADHPTLVA